MKENVIYSSVLITDSESIIHRVDVTRSGTMHGVRETYSSLIGYICRVIM